METKETILYRLDITSACKDAQCLMGIDTRNNTIQGKEIYFKSLDKAITYVKELLECGKRLSIIQGTDFNGMEITFNTILNDLTNKENDYTTNNGRLFMSLRSIEGFIGLQLSISKKTIYIVD